MINRLVSQCFPHKDVSDEIDFFIFVLGLSLSVSNCLLLAITPLASWYTAFKTNQKNKQHFDYYRYLKENRWRLSYSLFLGRLESPDFLEVLYLYLSETHVNLMTYLTSTLYPLARPSQSPFQILLNQANHPLAQRRIKAYKILSLGSAQLRLNELRYVLKDFNSPETNLTYWSSKLLLMYDFQEYSEKIYNRLIQNKSPFPESLVFSLLKPQGASQPTPASNERPFAKTVSLTTA